MKYILTKEKIQAKEFEYKGLKFKAIEEKVPTEEITNYINDSFILSNQHGFNYEEFYKEVKKTYGKTGFDIFLCIDKKKICVPTSVYLFEFNTTLKVI